MGHREDKLKARRDLHTTLEIPAFYFRSSGATTPLPVNVRLWVGFGLTGAVKGARIFPAEMQNETDKIRFQLSDFSRSIENGAVVVFNSTEAYLIDNILPIDGEFQTAEVTRASAAVAASLMANVG